MTWGCPHEINGYCSRRKLSCVPGEKGCILRGNYKFVQDEPRANKIVRALMPSARVKNQNSPQIESSKLKFLLNIDQSGDNSACIPLSYLH
jgi:hypothetical protein